MKMFSTIRSGFGKRMICFLFSLFACLSSFAQQNGDDPLLDVLKKQVQQDFQQLQQGKVPVYMLTYRVEQSETYYLQSSFGSVVMNDYDKQRLLTVQVRVGNSLLDNYHELRDDYSDWFLSERTLLLSLDDNEAALSQAIRQETDLAVREAWQRYQKVKANVAVKVDAADKAPDYTEAAVVHYVEPTDNYILDRNEWLEKLRRYSTPFRSEKQLLKGDASLRYVLNRKYLVNSEGTAIVENNTAAYLYLSAETMANDGMVLPLFNAYYAPYPNELPKDEWVVAAATDLAEKVVELKDAPVVEPFSGPAILSNEAAGVFFHEIYGHRLEASRMKNENDGQTFKKKLNEEVLNKALSLSFDPTVDKYENLPLNGGYHYDDEGVNGEKVTVIDHGILKNFLMTRTPIDGFSKSNGHARAQAGKQPVSRQSNLIVETNHPYTDEQLHDLLIAEAKAQGLEYGLYFKKVQGGFTTTGRYMPNAFNIMPMEVYKVFTDGRPDELVRGVDMVGTPLTMFSKIVAAGDRHAVYAGTCGAESGNIPVACCSPALFVSQIEVQKQNKQQSRPPILPKPTYSSLSFSEFEDAAFKAMEDEIKENIGKLLIPALKYPYYIGYLLTDAEWFSVKSFLGSIVSSVERKARNNETTVLVGNDQRNNLNFVDENTLFTYGKSRGLLPLDNDYNLLRNNLWLSTDQQYKNAAELYEKKIAALKQQNIPASQLNLQDRSQTVAANHIINESRQEDNGNIIENLALNASSLFNNYDFIVNSGVDIYGYRAYSYFRDSEGNKCKIPFSVCCLTIYAEAVATDGEPLADCIKLYFPSSQQLPSVEKVRQHIIDMAEKLRQLRQAPTVDEAYCGPVLLQGEALAVTIASAFFENEDGLLATRRPFFSNPEFADLYGHYFLKENDNEDLLNKKLVSRNLNIIAKDKCNRFEDTPLIGSYHVDADGVVPDDETPLIEKGVLVDLISNRIPTLHTGYSNGHNRLALTGETLTRSICPGVVEINAERTSSLKKIKKRLIALAKEEDYDYAYIITKIASSDMDGVPGMDKYLPQNDSPRPIYAYRIAVKDGSETPVRMAALLSVKSKTFKRIDEVSSQQQAYNTMLKGSNQSLYGSKQLPLCGVPCSFILPQAIIFQDLEITRLKNVTLKPVPLLSK